MLLTKRKKVAALLLVLSCVMLTSAMLVAKSPTRDSVPWARADRQVTLALASHISPTPQKKDQQNDPPKTFTNTVGMKFVWIPPGTFMMGSTEGEEGRLNTETQHKVTLTKGFYMGVYTVTQEQWQAVMGKNPSRFQHEKNLPVETVSWNHCQEFAKRLREKEKKPYRLPTEAEWEYACRAGTTTRFHFGDEITTDQANYKNDRKKTTPVGSFPANAWALHDMHGNVFQWCQDWYGAYPASDVVDPKGPEKGFLRVARGGAWAAVPELCRSAWRTAEAAGSRTDSLGLRLCFSLK